MRFNHDLEKDTILNFLERLRELYPDGYAPMSGGCFKLAALLKRVFDVEQVWYNVDHIITQIGDTCYDIDGVVERDASYLPIEAYSTEMIHAMPRGNELL